MAKQPESDTISIDEKSIVTVLADDIIFKGTLSFKTSLMIKGTFEGEIDATGELVIGDKAVVKANIKCDTIICYGKIEGNVETKKSMILARSAQISGDIKTPDLVIQSGCRFNGNCTMTTASAVAAPAPASAPAAGLPPKK